MGEIKKNFIFSSILTVSNYIFPFIIFPYISRILGVENIGICNFVDSIINYFMLFSMMGIGVVGVREIAAAKSNRMELRRVFTSLFFLTLISTTIAIFVLVFAVSYVESLEPYRCLLYIGTIKIFGNFLILDWLYRGLEDFKYITYRTIAVKICYLISVFCFVNTESDYYIYYTLLCLMVALNSIFSCFRAKDLLLLKFKELRLKEYITPLFTLGIYGFLTSLYTTFNVVYLGVSSGDVEVGYYATATKFFGVIIAIYTAFTTVMLPRMSALSSKDKKQEFIQLANKSVDLLVLVTIPILMFIFVFSREIIELFAGEGYQGAILPLRIVIILIFVIGYEQILIILMLTPLKKDKAILLNSILGAVVGIALNILLVSRYGSIGSSFVWVFSEIAVLISAQYFIFKYVNFKFPYKLVIRNLIYYIPFGVLCYILQENEEVHSYVILLLGGCLMVAYAFLVQNLFLKNEIFISQKNRIKERIKKGLV